MTSAQCAGTTKAGRPCKQPVRADPDEHVRIFCHRHTFQGQKSNNKNAEEQCHPDGDGDSSLIPADTDVPIFGHLYRLYENEDQDCSNNTEDEPIYNDKDELAGELCSDWNRGKDDYEYLQHNACASTITKAGSDHDKAGSSHGDKAGSDHGDKAGSDHGDKTIICTHEVIAVDSAGWATVPTAINNACEGEETDCKVPVIDPRTHIAQKRKAPTDSEVDDDGQDDARCAKRRRLQACGADPAEYAPGYFNGNDIMMMVCIGITFAASVWFESCR